MELQTDTILKINALPQELFDEVSDFVDYLYSKHRIEPNVEYDRVAEGCMSDYLANLIDYENSLAEGKVRW
ncbi:MAG: hypothetical protein WCT77_13160 [Bacteroidota bacterium]